MSIHYINTIFKEVTDKYPDWPSLQQYLESDACGNMRILDKSDNGLCIIRHDKGSTDRHFRSVVWDTIQNKPVCIAPSKPADTEFPYDTLQDAIVAGAVCEEFFDGFMINCFRRAGDPQLYITSRSKLDASGRFYSSKTFRQLFMEAYINSYLYSEHVQDNEALIQGDYAFLPGPDVSSGETARFYSFLVQHKDNHIVDPITVNCVKLIHIGVVLADGTIDMREHFMEFRGEPNVVPFFPTIQYGSEDGQTTIKDWISIIFKQRSYTFQGVVIKDLMGNRWRFRSDKYTAVRALRGNTASHIDRYAQLYTQNLTQMYLQYYPEDAFTFSFHSFYMNTITNNMYYAYVDLYIRKTITARQIDKMYHPHLYALHGQYLATKKVITVDDVFQYLYRQPWQRIAFLIKQSQDAYFKQRSVAVESQSF